MNRVLTKKEIKNNGDYSVERSMSPGEFFYTGHMHGKCPKCGQQFLVICNENEENMECFNKECDQQFKVENFVLKEVKNGKKAIKKKKKSEPKTTENSSKS